MSFTAETRERTRPVLPLAAMVDVLFLLLIFFMTTSTLRERELQIPIDVPAAQTGEGAASATQIVLSADEQGKLYLGQHELAGLGELRDKLIRLYEDYPNEVVIVRVDAGGSWGQGMQLIDVAREVGFRQIEASVAKALGEAP